jgi:6-pyruvoyltetrahydropterin/6-carboxytetrahydropterin synthase
MAHSKHVGGFVTVSHELARVPRGASHRDTGETPVLHFSMPFEIRTVRTFSAAHQLRLYDGSLEPLHGHNWRISVTVSADQLDSIGVVMDFHELARLVDDVVEPMHNRSLNDLPAFASVNPTTENVAMHVARSLKLPAGVRLSKVEVWETWDCSAVYRPANG